jgi:hypothetical protein
VFWDVTPCSPVEESELSARFLGVKSQNISTVHSHCRENPESSVNLSFIELFSEICFKRFCLHLKLEYCFLSVSQNNIYGLQIT